MSRMTAQHGNPGRRGGFTLIELLVVISVIIILLTIGVVVTTRLLSDARRERARAVVHKTSAIIAAIEAHRGASGRALPLDHKKLGMDTSAIYEEAQKCDDAANLLAGIETELVDESKKKIYDPWDEELVWASSVDGEIGVSHTDGYKNDDFLPAANTPIVASSGKDRDFGDAKNKPDGQALKDNVYSVAIEGN